MKITDCNYYIICWNEKRNFHFCYKTYKAAHRRFSMLRDTHKFHAELHDKNSCYIIERF